MSETAITQVARGNRSTASPEPTRCRSATSAPTLTPATASPLPSRRGYVDVSHGVELPGEELFFSGVHLHGGPAPVRRFLPELIDLIVSRQIDPGRVFDLTLPLDQAADGYGAMDERRAVKTLLRP